MRFLFICNHSGGTNAILPFIRKYSSKKNKSYIITSVLNQNLTTQKNSKVKIIKKKINFKTVKFYLERIKPDIIITGTSEIEDPKIGRLESKFIFTAKKMGIFTITILDFGTRFKERFSLNNKNLLDALPDKICVPYNKMKNRMINMGFDRKKIAVIGNPYLDSKYKIKGIKDSKNIKAKYKRKISSKNIIYYVSQPITDRSNIKNYLPIKFNEITVLCDIINIIRKLIKNRIYKKIKLIIKIHPSENKKKFINLFRFYDDIDFEIDDDNESTNKYVNNANYIIGMFSMFLVELSYRTNNVISYQPSNNNNFINLSKIKIIQSKEVLYNHLRLKIKTKQKKYKYQNSIEKLGKLIDKYTHGKA